MRVFGTIDNAYDLVEPERLRESEEVIRQVDTNSDGIYLFNTQPYHLAFLLMEAAPAGNPGNTSPPGSGEDRRKPG